MLPLLTQENTSVDKIVSALCKRKQEGVQIEISCKICRCHKHVFSFIYIFRFFHLMTLEARAFYGITFFYLSFCLPISLATYLFTYLSF